MESWNEEYCKKVINEFINDNEIENFKSSNRKYKRNIVTDETSWIWESVDNLIKSTLGYNYYLSQWIIGLKYDKGDYFREHYDAGGSSEARALSGGIELSDRNDFDGGKYVINGLSSNKKRGHLFAHKTYEIHEITKVTRGTRYSLHFCIGKSSSKLI
jgi:predicted 2-oxoglutarate/Fe(II)-dependent dioxygenase YbiX|tara:strand:- start:46 stop:519 length:474 start_codon:yes stop_codon:yes gene_type:complete